MNRNSFHYALNTSTLRPYDLSVPEQITTAAEAGFDGIELWVRDIQAHVAAGGSAAEIRSLAEDRGIRIVNGIAFFKWTDADPAIRAQGLEQAREEIDLLASLGCGAVAAPPTGEVASLSLEQIAANFRELAPVARERGVEPILEFWGRAPVLHSVAEAITVLDAAGIPDTTVLLDLFHMYTGGSVFSDMARLGGDRIGLVHMNDYPAAPPRESITDADRVMPGDGVGGAAEFLSVLGGAGYSGYLSVELFQPEYAAGSAPAVAAEALEKTRGCVEAAK